MIKCGADERRRRGLDRAEPLFSPVVTGENANDSLRVTALFEMVSFLVLTGIDEAGGDSIGFRMQPLDNAIK